MVNNEILQIGKRGIKKREKKLKDFALRRKFKGGGEQLILAGRRSLLRRWPEEKGCSCNVKRSSVGVQGP